MDRLKLALRVATVVSMSALATLLAVWVVPFVTTPQGMTASLRSMTTEPAFLSVYVVLVLCSGAAVVIGVVRYLGAPPLGTLPLDPGQVRARGLRADAAFDEARVTECLAAAGFGGFVVALDGSVRGVRNRWSGLAVVVVHAAVLLLAIGAFTAVRSGLSFRGEVTLAEGEALQSARAQWQRVSPADAVTPKVDLVLSSIRVIDPPGPIPPFALATLLNSSQQTRFATSWSPWFASPELAVQVADVGQTLTIRAQAATAQPEPDYVFKTGPLSAEEAAVMVSAGGRDYRLYVHGSGSKTSVAGGAPLVVDVYRRLGVGTEVPLLKDARLSVGEPLQVGDAKITVVSVGQYGVVRVVRTPGGPWLILGLVAVAVACVMTLWFPRQEAAVFDDDQGVMVMVSDATYLTDGHRARRIVEALDGWEVSR